MPTTKSAMKRVRQNQKRRLRNSSFKSKLRTHRRKLLRAIADQKKEESRSLLRAVISLYDKGVKKRIYKANTAARQKSRLTRKVNTLLSSTPPGPQASQPASQPG